MDTLGWIVLLVVFVAAISGGGLLIARSSGRRGATKELPAAPRPGLDYVPGVGDDAEIPRDTPSRTLEQVVLPPSLAPGDLAPGDLMPGVLVPKDAAELVAPPAAFERPDPTSGRLARLRARLSRSQTALGRGLLALLSRDRIDEDTWVEIEDTLLLADLGAGAAAALVERLRTRVRVEGVHGEAAARSVLREELLDLVDTSLDRTLRTGPVTLADGSERPGVVLVVGVNGTGKTTTTGKLARMLVADNHVVLLGAADTFRAAAADQLQTWGSRVGAQTVRGPEGGDPASVAFDAVKRGQADGVDTVLLDTAGRLHTKTGLMDELGKVKRVVEKLSPVDEVLLVLDATTGQNGMIQARVFAEVVEITGIVLTKLDGTAKGGIVVAVQRELGVPVKLIGLGEGPDDLAPFDPAAFVDALLDG